LSGIAITGDKYNMSLCANNVTTLSNALATDVTVNKKRRIRIHDSDSDEKTVGKCDSAVQFESSPVPKTIAVTSVDCILPATSAILINITDADAVDSSAVLGLKKPQTQHSRHCCCTRCTDASKYMDVTAKHMGSDTSGTTGSSDSDDFDSFICSEDDNFTKADEIQLKILFPITAKRMLQRTVQQQP
jgi:hypothetical protein